jgi:hypothetical protein
MALTIDTTVGGADTNSYIEVSEVGNYLGAESFLPDSVADRWGNLESSQQINCAVLAADFLDALPFKGKPACIAQAREFPRWKPTDAGYLVEYATYGDIDVAEAPVVSYSIKYAQIEIILVVIVDWLLERLSDGLDPLRVAGINIPGSLNLTLSNSKSSGFSVIARETIGPSACYMIRLREWLTSVVGTGAV